MTDAADPTTPMTPAAAGEPQTPEEIRAQIDQTREQLGETVEALAAKTDVKARAHDQIESVKETIAQDVAAVRMTVTQKAEELKSKARESTPESASAGAQQVTATIQRRPLPFSVAGAFMAGLLIGWWLGRR